MSVFEVQYAITILRSAAINFLGLDNTPNLAAAI
jgi:hypothetical protein